MSSPILRNPQHLFVGGFFLTVQQTTFAAETRHVNTRPLHFSHMITSSIGFCTRLSGFIVAAALLVPLQGKSQLARTHLDLGAQYTMYHVQHLEGFENGRPGSLLRLGLSFYASRNRRFFGMCEMGGLTRRVTHSIDAYDFRYRFFTLQIPIYMRWEANEYWHFELGASTLLYTRQLSKNHGSEDSALIRIGSGFRSFDVAAIGGVLYHIKPRVAIGTRANVGLIPMMKFQRIAPMGELEPRTLDMRANTFELYFRFHMLP